MLIGINLNNTPKCGENQFEITIQALHIKYNKPNDVKCNALPPDIRNTTNRTVFKRALKTHSFKLAYNVMR